MAVVKIHTVKINFTIGCLFCSIIWIFALSMRSVLLHIIMAFVLFSFTAETVQRLIVPDKEELVLKEKEAEEKTETDKYGNNSFPVTVEKAIYHAMTDQQYAIAPTYLLPPAHTLLPELPPKQI